ncbi:MAG: polymer-forming cytoskeletal protein [Verrucomicrobiae bacterium]|nr:polymer-forming cytoskeletal protein [Verrucomicrobiae bacterium]
MSSHLSNDIRIEGNLSSTSDLIFDGSIKGNIEAKGTLTIGKNADVEGDLKADRVIIEGKVNGKGTFGHCRIAATAQISGSVATASLQMEEGASLSGDCRVGKSAN